MVGRNAAILAAASLAAWLAAGCTVTVESVCDACAAGGARPKQIIETAEAPAAIGPYSQAVRVGEVLYLSGQIAIDPASGKLVPGGVEAETRQVLENIGAVLEAAGMSFADVVQVQVFLEDIDNYALVNRIYAGYFEGAYPARAAVQVARLPRDVSIEIMAVAVRGAGRPR